MTICLTPVPLIGYQMAKFGVGWLGEADNDNAPSILAFASAEGAGPMTVVLANADYA